nr:outer membrane beta-barrel protein [Allomuricauda sp.]
MKKTITTTIFLFLVILTTNAQVDRSSFKAGLTAGIPVGDASEVSSFSIGFDVNYHWGISRLLDVGFATGFLNAFGDTETINVGGFEVEGEFEDYQIIPAAASVRLYPTYEFKLGADLGYAIGVNEGNEGGFYYRPIVGYNITGNTEINVSYTAIENDPTFSFVMAGVLFLF